MGNKRSSAVEVQNGKGAGCFFLPASLLTGHSREPQGAGVRSWPGDIFLGKKGMMQLPCVGPSMVSELSGPGTDPSCPSIEHLRAPAAPQQGSVCPVLSAEAAQAFAASWEH